MGCGRQRRVPVRPHPPLTLQPNVGLTSFGGSYAENPKFQKQLTQALESGVPLLVIIGEDELARGEVAKRLEV